MGSSSSKRRNGAVGVLVGALLLSGLFVGISQAGGGGITEPQVLELVTYGCSTDDGDPATGCRVFYLRDDEGKRSGEIFRFRTPIADVDGNPVGQGFLQCDIAKGTGRTCTLVLSLKPGPHTELGTIVATGVESFPPPAITGGSGAYLNVRGDITGEDQNDGFHLFVNLIP
jgi:hypothetical protein